MSDKASPDRVRAVMMYAAARYNQLNWLTSTEVAAQSVDDAAAHFHGEYETMFRENVKEMEPVYRPAGRRRQ